MEHPIIEVKNIGKKYNITHQRGGYVALRDVLMNVIKSPLSFLKTKAKQVIGLETKEDFWALKNINFKVNKGEVVGIIGSNGAGKSTLLKILSQITPPTTGEIKIRGRVGSLLEVGTGFHPELTGRENIFLNGAILGMTEREIVSKFDEIVTFAGIEKFLDTPVKHYSSGMYVRLAFSVAAHMEPEILIIDEVLAVGDAEFQKKCLGKMDEITKKEGRTILFVSHNMSAIQQLCTKTILLKKGSVEYIGDTAKVIELYLEKLNGEKIDLSKEIRRGDGRILLKDFYIENEGGKKTNSINSNESITFVLSYVCDNPQEIKEVDVGFSIHKDGVMISKMYGSGLRNKQLFTNISKYGEFRIKIMKLPLKSGSYEIGLRVLADGIESDWPKKSIGSVIINNDDYPGERGKTPNDGYIYLDCVWEQSKPSL